MPSRQGGPARAPVGWSLGWFGVGKSRWVAGLVTPDGFAQNKFAYIAKAGRHRRLVGASVAAEEGPEDPGGRRRLANKCCTVRRKVVENVTQFVGKVGPLHNS